MLATRLLVASVAFILLLDHCEQMSNAPVPSQCSLYSHQVMARLFVTVLVGRSTFLTRKQWKTQMEIASQEVFYRESSTWSRIFLDVMHFRVDWTWVSLLMSWVAVNTRTTIVRNDGTIEEVDVPNEGGFFSRISRRIFGFINSILSVLTGDSGNSSRLDYSNIPSRSSNEVERELMKLANKQRP